MLPWVCSVIDHRRRQNVVRTSVTHSAAPRVPLFCSYHILTSSVIYYWTDARQHGIYLLKWNCIIQYIQQYAFSRWNTFKTMPCPAQQHIPFRPNKGIPLGSNQRHMYLHCWSIKWLSTPSQITNKKVKKYCAHVFAWLLLQHLLPESQVFSVGRDASRTQDSPARWGIATILHVVNTEALTQFDWLLLSMNSDVSTDDSQDYSVSYFTKTRFVILKR